MSIKTATRLGLIALAVALLSAAVWAYQIWRVSVPLNPVLLVAAFLCAAALGIAALSKGTTWLGGITATTAIVIGLLLPFSMIVSPQKAGDDVIQVGDRIPAFTGVDDSGAAFDSESLKGRALLIKFFRAHWCPYCVAELRRWNELREELDRRDIQVLTVSTDSPQAIHAERSIHGLQAIMLSDSSLTVTDAFGLRNMAVDLAADDTAGLPIPTTLLVDQYGTVVWMDMANNYQRRSGPEVILQAMQTYLDRR